MEPPSSEMARNLFLYIPRSSTPRSIDRKNNQPILRAAMLNLAAEVNQSGR